MATSHSIRVSLTDTMPQLACFAIAGLAITALSALIYLALAAGLHVPPLVANVGSHLCGVLLGFQVHGRWSFQRDPGCNGIAQLARFAEGSGASLLLDSLWVWMLVDAAGAPAWASVPAMICVTPLASFPVNRFWVFA